MKVLEMQAAFHPPEHPMTEVLAWAVENNFSNRIISSSIKRDAIQILMLSAIKIVFLTSNFDFVVGTGNESYADFGGGMSPSPPALQPIG